MKPFGDWPHKEFVGSSVRKHSLPVNSNVAIATNCRAKPLNTIIRIPTKIGKLGKLNLYWLKAQLAAPSIRKDEYFRRNIGVRRECSNILPVQLIQFHVSVEKQVFNLPTSFCDNHHSAT